MKDLPRWVMRKTRLFFSDNGSLIDWTVSLGDYKSGAVSASIVPAQDYFYVGSVAPFNHLYFKLGSTVNASSGTISIEYWDGNSWSEVIETMDETSGFTQSGFITWVPDRQSSWIRSNTNLDGQAITGLTSLQIYDLYWARLKFTGTFDAGIQFAWAGQKFSDDNDLGAEFPDLVRATAKTAFEAGKTSYEEQAVRAAEVIVQDLIKENIIWNKNQILDREEFKLMSVSKVAEIIYNAFGDDYLDQKQAARNEYQSRFKKVIYSVDKNSNATLEIGEQKFRQGYMTR